MFIGYFDPENSLRAQQVFEFFGLAYHRCISYTLFIDWHDSIYLFPSAIELGGEVMGIKLTLGCLCQLATSVHVEGFQLTFCSINWVLHPLFQHVHL